MQISTCAYLISTCGIRRRVIASKMADCKLQLVTDITQRIAFEEPALIKEMIAILNCGARVVHM